MTLNEMYIGQVGYVLNINSEGSMRRRLQDIGLIQGTKVQCVLKSPASDPIAFYIRGALIALRQEDMCQIQIIERDDDE